MMTEKTSKSRILVVDDEPFIRENLKDILNINGYDVLTAESGSEGWEKFKTDPPDLVLLDLMLPDINGHTVCTRAKSSPDLRNVPIVMLTALNETEDTVSGLEVGADDYIGKPFKEKELLARIHAQLRIKKLHDELKQSYMKLKKVEELKDSLTHMIVHDLKTPIITVKGWIQIILESTEETGGALDQETKLFLKKAFTGSGRLLDLVDDILDISRLEQNLFPLNKREVKIDGLIQSCVQFLEPMAKQNNVQFVKNVRPALPPVYADEHLLYRIFSNLISNSLKFTKRGGSVTVSANLLQGENTLRCSIEDTGMGIPKEALESIFDKFFQGKDNKLTRKGQGLGLYFCRMAVEAHGGKIWAESNGTGSKFIFDIPLK